MTLLTLKGNAKASTNPSADAFVRLAVASDALISTTGGYQVEAQQGSAYETIASSFRNRCSDVGARKCAFIHHHHV